MTEQTDADRSTIEQMDFIRGLQALATARKERGKNQAEDYPGLIDKVSRHEDMPESEYHALIPRLAFANLNDFQISIMTGLDEPIMNDLLYMVKQGWLPIDVAKDWGARWTVGVEASRARNAQWTEYVFAQISKTLFKKNEDHEKKGVFGKKE